MAKHYNKAEILAEIKLKKTINSLIPQIYASMVITLIEHYDWSFDAIRELLERDQDVWNECNRQGIGMLKKCSEEYGIDLVEIVGGDDSGEYKQFL